MELKKIRKAAGRFFGWLGLYSCSLIIKVLPYRWLYGFAAGLANIGYLIARKQKRIALESLDIAFGSARTSEEKEEIARRCFVFMAKSALELLFLIDRPGLLQARLCLAGKEHLDNGLAKGKGVILTSAHFGNFPLMLCGLALSGYKICGIMRPMRDSRAEQFFLDKRNRIQVKTIYSQPRKECVDNSLRVLRENGVLFIPIDQNFGSGGIFVNFFGRQAATATGPVVLAKRTGAALIPCFIVRQPDDTHQIIFEPALDIGEGRPTQEAVSNNIQKLTDVIESYIRQYPAEWGWIHRRWKTRPTEKVLSQDV